MGEQSKLTEAGKSYSKEQAGPGADADSELDEKRQNRSYNPADDAQRATISEKLNEDSGRYRKGPGPL